jgi:hypothetical protein
LSIDMDAVGIYEHAGAKILHRIARRVEFENRREIRAKARTRGAAVSDPDRGPVGVDINRARGSQRSARRHLEVLLDRLIGIGQVRVGGRPILRETRDACQRRDEKPAGDPLRLCGCHARL